MAGKVLISTVPRAAEIERSSGGATSGVAIMAVSTRAATPMAPRAQPRIRKLQRIIARIAISPSATHSPIQAGFCDVIHDRRYRSGVADDPHVTDTVDQLDGHALPDRFLIL